MDELYGKLLVIKKTDANGNTVEREDMRNRPFLDRKAVLEQLLRTTEAGILFNEHIVEDGPIVFAHACRLGRGHRVEESR